MTELDFFEKHAYGFTVHQLEWWLYEDPTISVTGSKEYVERSDWASNCIDAGYADPSTLRRGTSLEGDFEVSYDLTEKAKVVLARIIEIKKL